MHIIGEIITKILMTALVGMLILFAFLWLGPSIYGITFGESGSYINFNQAVFNDGYYYLAGTKANKDSLEQANAYLLKVNQAGEEIWDKELNSLGMDKFYALEKTEDNNLLLAGYKSDYLSNNNSYLAKVNIDGEIKWELELEAEYDNLFYDIVETESSYFIAGMTRGSNVEDSLGVLLEVNKSGEKKNITTYEKDQGVSFNSAINLGDELILAGHYLDNAYQQRGYFIKTEQSGDIISEHKIEEITEPMSISDVNYNNNSLIVVGTIDNLGDKTGYIANYNLAGEKIWAQQLDNQENHYQFNAVDIIDEKIVVAGKEYTSGLISSTPFAGEMTKIMLDNAYAAMYDLNGDLIWEQTYRSQESGGYYDVSIFDQEHLILTGELGDFPGEKHGYLNKIDLSGESIQFDIQDVDIF